MADTLIAPPIRTALMNNPDGTPMTQTGTANGSGSSNGGQLTIQKDWYRYWRDCGSRINTDGNKLDNLVTFGAHANRPDAANMPNGALYFESDRSVIYANIGGVWHYAAGTMWGTLSPDQRPTDLGVNDAGFDFRTTDEPAREFIWSQAQWIEATPVRYGTHAARLAVNVAAVIEQMLWVETDRGALYQLMAVSGPTPVWQYIAGTMWGTLSPDQRPTDLGTHDAGFDFRGTDQQREFIWSQAAWVEVTPIGGGGNLTHSNVMTRVGAAGTVVEGGITDMSAADSQSLYISASGQLGIGTTAPVEALDLGSGGANSGTWRCGATADGGYAMQLTAPGGNTYMDFVGTLNLRPKAGVEGGIGATAIMVLNSGQVGIGVSPSYQLQLNVDSAGKPSTSTWTIVSDTRTKRNVTRWEGDIDVIRKLDPIVAEYNGLAGTPEGARVVGFDAAKLREIVPQCVSSIKRKLRESDPEETEVLSVNIHEILFHMLRAVQQIDRRLSQFEKT